MVNIVNVVDPSLVDEYLQSPSGQKQVINIIRANNPAVRSALAKLYFLLTDDSTRASCILRAH